MRPQEDRVKFVQMRAEGKSYDYIAKALSMSKSTCQEWEQQLKEAIADLKREQLAELYEQYHMTREARITRLGDTLASINDALDNVDLSTVPPERLLDFKLKYTEALKEEYIALTPGRDLGKDFNAHDVLNSIGDLLDRIRAGEVTAEQAGRESMVFANLLKAYDAVAIQPRLDALEAIIAGRQ